MSTRAIAKSHEATFGRQSAEAMNSDAKRDISKVSIGVPAGFFGRFASLDPLPDLYCEMRLNFVVEILFYPATTEEQTYEPHTSSARRVS